MLSDGLSMSKKTSYPNRSLSNAHDLKGLSKTISRPHGYPDNTLLISHDELKSQGSTFLQSDLKSTQIYTTNSISNSTSVVRPKFSCFSLIYHKRKKNR